MLLSAEGPYARATVVQIFQRDRAWATEEVRPCMCMLCSFQTFRLGQDKCAVLWKWWRVFIVLHCCWSGAGKGRNRPKALAEVVCSAWLSYVTAPRRQQGGCCTDHFAPLGPDTIFVTLYIHFCFSVII